MAQQNYRKRYSVFLASLQQTEMIMFAATNAIPDIPTKVKEENKPELPFYFIFSRRILSEAADGWKTDHKLLGAESLMQLVFDGQKEQILAYHELTMIVAHLEAFVIDTLKSIWQSNPSLLMSSKIGEKIIKRLGFSNPSSLTPTQLEELYNLTAWTLLSRSPERYLRYFQEDLKLPINTNNRLLLRASYDRNAIVHNGGLMSQKKYIDKLSINEKVGLIAGEAIQISTSYIIEIYNLVQSLGESIFEETSKRYFDISEPLKDNERVVNRQNSEMKTNPLDEYAEQALSNVGGADKALDNPKLFKAEMIRLMNESKK